ncbi:MAG: EAL domain-containing protein [Bacillota bacterium]|nr:EAL domain-containing protein [Bacillota bacterium]
MHKKGKHSYTPQYIFRVFLILCLVFFICTVNIRTKIYAKEIQEKKVLVIHSYDMDFQWTSDIAKGIKSVLGNDIDNVDIYSCYLDTKKIQLNDYIEQLYNYQKEKYKNIHFDAIICSDNDALNYLLKYRDKLFPNTPVVFCGINGYKDGLTDNNKLYTGVAEEIDIKSTIESILELQPNIKNLIVVGDSSAVGTANYAQLKELLPYYDDRINFVIFTDEKLDRLTNYANENKVNTAILYMGQVRDNDNLPIALDKGAELILNSTGLPIYSFWDFLLGHGAVGGKMTNGFYQGKTAGELTKRILNGEDIRKVPVIKEGPNMYMFDYKELVRNKINLYSVPPDSTIINEPISIYDSYKKTVLVSLAVFIGLISCIVVLSRNITRRKISENKLKDSYQELSAVYEQLTAAEEELKAQYDELQQNQEFLRESEERYKIAIEGANDAIWHWDFATNRVLVSSKWEDISGYPIKEDLKMEDIWGTILDLEHKHRTLHDLKDHIQKRKDLFISEFIITTKEGEKKWVLGKGKVLNDIEGNPVKMAGSLSDITEMRNMQEKVNFMAYYDSLTNLPNKTLFMDRLNVVLNKSRVDGEKGAVLFIDLDDFKKVNDTLGHEYGDKLLICIGNILKSTVTDYDTVCRLGGDDFLILKTNIDSYKDIIILVDKILEFFNSPFEVDEKQIYITASIGITLFPYDGLEANIILKNADTAMYKAKATGIGKYQFYSRKMYQEVLRNSEIERGLRKAIENDELKLFYQVQVDAKTGKITGMESLIRWFSKELGFVPPSEFIPIAEKSGLIINIGEWILKTACKQNVEWRQKGYKFDYIAVNVSAIQLQHPSFLATVKEVIDELKLSPEYIELEITESVLMQSLNDNVKILDQIKAMGVKSALDDFGTGYSSLSYLRMLPISTLKIDKSFIDDIAIDNNERSIIDGIIQLAHKMNLDVVAEGVEVQEQLNVLSEMNCDKIQGYYFSKPLPPDEVAVLLEQGGFQINHNLEPESEI